MELLFAFYSDTSFLHGVSMNFLKITLAVGGFKSSWSSAIGPETLIFCTNILKNWYLSNKTNLTKLSDFSQLSWKLHKIKKNFQFCCYHGSTRSENRCEKIPIQITEHCRFQGFHNFSRLCIEEGDQRDSKSEV